jgi:hypothetical protein
MFSLTRATKIATVISLAALLGYLLYVLVGGYQILFGYFMGVRGDVGYVTRLGFGFWASTIGITARFIGCVLGLVAVYLLWVKQRPFQAVKWVVVVALILDSLNFLGLIPNTLLMLKPGTFFYNPSLGYGYVAQIIFTIPFLWLLAAQVGVYTKSQSQSTLLKAAVLAFVGYVVALAANEVSRWTSMISAESLQFIQGSQAIGFYDALILMPLAVAFAVVAGVGLFRKKIRFSMFWAGVSLAAIGLNYIVYLFFLDLVGRLSTAPLVDIWAIPLFALGLALAWDARRAKLQA